MPTVTEIRFCVHIVVQFSDANCTAVNADASRAEANPLANIPAGMKYMLATQCSNPEATKAVIGKKMPRNLPPADLLAIASTIARHTSQLQPIPRKKNATLWLTPSIAAPLTFAAAMLMATPPTGPASRADHFAMISASRTDPTRFPK